ncbi:tripartite motif-containing protein 3-like [Patiria miniata]|uniref:Uncharacterized protein n=1 Tax=Patiria miniata TaxID=46514 RepID=A0A914ABX3_PATMI|nr:tripartite motif-containing protein 3-like [Patiria miniata]
MSAPSLDVGDQLECPICLDQLWEPKLLNCGHTFCLKCLDGVFEPEEFPQNPVVACPVCRKKTPVPNKGVAGLTSNFALQSLLEALSPLKPKTTAEVAKTADGEATICEIHNEIRKFYCSSCEVLICRDCTVVDHPRPEHKCMNLDEAYTWRRELNDKELQLAVRVVKLAKRSKGILQSAEATLNERCNQVISEIEKCRETGLEQLQRKTEAIEAFQVDLESEILGLHDLSEDATKTDLLDQSKGVIESLTSLREQKDEMLDKPEAVEYPVFVGSSEEIQGWPKQLNLDKSGKGRSRKPRPRRQQSDGSGQSKQETSITSDESLVSNIGQMKFASLMGQEPMIPVQGGYWREIPMDKGQPNRGRGYYHHHRGRGGQDNRGRGGPDHRGRGGNQNRGRGGKRGGGGAERGRGSGNQKAN